MEHFLKPPDNPDRPTLTPRVLALLWDTWRQVLEGLSINQRGEGRLALPG